MTTTAKEKQSGVGVRGNNTKTNRFEKGMLKLIQPFNCLFSGNFPNVVNLAITKTERVNEFGHEGLRLQPVRK